jgi:hypothetical protein
MATCWYTGIGFPEGAAIFYMCGAVATIQANQVAAWCGMTSVVAHFANPFHFYSSFLLNEILFLPIFLPHRGRTVVTLACYATM